MSRVGRAWDHAEAFLKVPADDDLGCGLAVSLSDCIDYRVAENLTVAVAAAEREPALYLDVILLGHFLPMLALGVRMALNLEHLGLDFRWNHDGLEEFVIEIEVADAYGADFPHFKGLLKFLPGSVIVARRLMQVHEIQIFKSKPGKHLVQLRESLPLSVLVWPEFGSDPYLLARNTAVLHGLTYATLVLVSMCSIDVPVAGLEGGENAVICGFACGDGIDAESELRDDDPVVEGDGFLVHRKCCVLIVISSICVLCGTADRSDYGCKGEDCFHDYWFSDAKVRGFSRRIVTLNTE